MEKLRTGEIDAVIVVRGQAVQVRQQVPRTTVPSGYGRLRQTAAGRLSAGDLDREGLSEPDRGQASRSTPSRCRRCWRPITGRPTPTAIASSRCSWTPSSRNSRPSRIRLSIRSGRKSRCRRRCPAGNRLPAAKQWLDQHGIEPVARNRFDEFLKQTPGSGGQVAVADRQGSAVQAIPGLGSRAERLGAGPSGQTAAAAIIIASTDQAGLLFASDPARSRLIN